MRKFSGTGLAACAILSIGGSWCLAGQAWAQTPVTIAECTQNLKGSFTSPLDPGGTNTPQDEVLTLQGAINCWDAGGNPFTNGTAKATVTIPAALCTGSEAGATVVEQITWSDGSTTNFTIDAATAEPVDGVTVIAQSALVSSDSTLFAGATATVAGIATGQGCGTQAGESNVDDELTVIFTE